MEYFDITYGIYGSKDAAERALEDAFATGDILAGERPAIVHRRGRYVIVTRHAVDVRGSYRLA